MLLVMMAVMMAVMMMVLVVKLLMKVMMMMIMIILLTTPTTKSRFFIHDVSPTEAALTKLENAFVLIGLNRSSS